MAMAAVLVVSAAGAGYAQAPSGAEFLVNTYTTGGQAPPDVATDASGNFVVVWEGRNQDGTFASIFGQRFAASGTRVGSEFEINSYTTDSQRFPSVASDTNGNFVVVWMGAGQDGSGYGVFGHRFAASGAPLGGEFQVNSFTTGNQRFPTVASDPNGNFVVVWESEGADGDGYGVFGQRFNATGTRLGSEFRVNSYTTTDQRRPAVTVDPSGNFVVVWTSRGGGGTDNYFTIAGRRYDASGTPLASEFQVNSYTTGDQDRARVAFNRYGEFVVVWISYGGQDGSGSGIFGQFYDPTGTPYGSEFQVNTYTPGHQLVPRVASDEGGSFVVVWASQFADGSGYGIAGQGLDALGPQGAEFQINSYTTGLQMSPAIARSPDGDFVVAWYSNGPDGDTFGIFAQKYGDIIFEDGFESGDLTRWSSAVTGGGDVTVTGAAALANTGHGMQAVVNDTTGIYVLDDSPSAETHYRARFYFDTNGFDPGEAQSHFRTRIFIAFDGLNQRQITVVLKRQSGQYSVEGRVRRDDGTRADTGFVDIPAGPNFVEFAWNRASRMGGGDGDFLFIVNDDAESQISLSGIDNGAANVEFARMGAMSVKTGAAGTLFFDQFESRRTTPIGAECCQQF
jgi:hypothetical protein